MSTLSSKNVSRCPWRDIARSGLMLLSVSLVSITSSSVRRRWRRLQTLVSFTNGCSIATSNAPATTANRAICQDATTAITT